MSNASFKLTLSGCVISICCVGFTSLDVVCNELNDCAWNVVCSSFLISVYMFIVLKLCSYRVLQGLFAQRKPFGYTSLLRCYLVSVVQSLCSVMFCTRVAWMCLVRLLLCREESSSSVFLQLLSQLPCVRYYVFVKSSFKHTREEC